MRQKCIQKRYWKDSDPLQMFIIVAVLPSAHLYLV